MRAKTGGDTRPKTLLDAFALAAELVGDNGRGRGGLVGYLRRIASEEPVAFLAAWGRAPALDARNPPTPEPVIAETIEELAEAMYNSGLHAGALEIVVEVMREYEARGKASEKRIEEEDEMEEPPILPKSAL